MDASVQNQTIKSICIVRLSAIGDVTHMIPVIHTIHKYRPDIKITWIIGSVEYKLVDGLPNVEFIQFNKNKGLKAYLEIRKLLRGRKFDALLAMQVSLRANIISGLINASRKIGYDSNRAKDLHSLFIHEKIKASKEHVVDAFFQFIEHIGISHKLLDWSIPVSPADQNFATTHIPHDKPILAISPCSSHALRNWNASGYAAAANYAAEHYQMVIVLLGGNSEIERQFGDQISQQLNTPAIDLIGKDTLKKLLAVLEKSTILLTPDSGPAHMASCVNTPVIGLYAASNCQRSGPYLSRNYCVDKYEAAAQLIHQKSANELKWGAKLEKQGVMDLIQADDVIMKIDTIMQKHN